MTMFKKVPYAKPQSGTYNVFSCLKLGLEDLNVLYTFKIKIESQNQNMGVLRFSDHIPINIKMPNPSQEPPSSFKATYDDFAPSNAR